MIGVLNNIASNIHKVFLDCDVTEWRGPYFYLSIIGTPLWWLAHSRDSISLNKELRHSWLVILSQEETRTEHFRLCYMKMKAFLNGLWINLRGCLVWSNRRSKSVVRCFFGSQWWTEQIPSWPIQNLNLAHYLSHDHLYLNSHEFISLMVHKDDAFIL